MGCRARSGEVYPLCFADPKTALSLQGHALGRSRSEGWRSTSGRLHQSLLDTKYPGCKGKETMFPTCLPTHPHMLIPSIVKFLQSPRLWGHVAGTSFTFKRWNIEPVCMPLARSKILQPTMQIWEVPMCLAQSSCCCHVAMLRQTFVGWTWPRRPKPPWEVLTPTHALMLRAVAMDAEANREAALGRLRGLVSSLQPETVQWDYILSARLQRDNRFLVSMYLVATPSDVQH